MSLFTWEHTRNRKSVSSYDFQTLYTHIPHCQLKANLKKLVNRAFDIKKKKNICVTEKIAFLSDKEHKNMCCFSCKSLISAIFYLVNNSYVMFNGIVYRQIVGIPMGSNAAPHMAYGYLAVYEYEYIQRLVLIGKLDEVKLLQHEEIPC